ncbi:MAG: type I glyceraldehyde-3-phosphate dehydrogenase [Acidiferrobacterales bacterium]|nr:type I glyceraldehyde-3-phosphate dehydrogenase [Acidiferrobacterales bacterium]
MLNIAINGFGRIGRNVIRAIYENGYQDKVKVVAINDLAPTESNAHLLQFDTTHGRFNATIDSFEDSIAINGETIPAYMQRDPAQLPWQQLGVDIVFECTGFFRAREDAQLHIDAGAKRVLVSAPGKKLDKTIVYGVNDDLLTAEDVFVSNASCTTNCLAHVAKALHDAVGIEEGLANTIHAYTNTQNLLDSFHKDKRRMRAANYSMIPTSTGSAKAIGMVIPELDGKLDAVSVRVPTLNVSLLDFTFTPSKTVSLDDIDAIFSAYQKGREGVFAISKQPLVSIDYNHHPASCVLDIEQTRISGNMIKVMAWYDNEWGFSNRMLDTALAIYHKSK